MEGSMTNYRFILYITNQSPKPMNGVLSTGDLDGQSNHEKSNWAVDNKPGGLLATPAKKSHRITS